VIGLTLFTAVILSLVVWARFGGDAGTQRGLVLRNQVSETIVVSFEDGQRATIESNTAGTFVLKREDFPQTVTATTVDGDVIAEREFEYSEFADNEFRWDVDRAGFFPTEESRTVTP
jgi:hypothetical protein